MMTPFGGGSAAPHRAEAPLEGGWMRRSATVPSSDRRARVLARVPARVPVALLACLLLAGTTLLACDGVRDEVGLAASTEDQPAAPPTTAPPSTTSTTAAPQ